MSIVKVRNAIPLGWTAPLRQRSVACKICWGACEASCKLPWGSLKLPKSKGEPKRRCRMIGGLHLGVEHAGGCCSFAKCDFASSTSLVLCRVKAAGGVKTCCVLLVSACLLLAELTLVLCMHVCSRPCMRT